MRGPEIRSFIACRAVSEPRSAGEGGGPKMTEVEANVDCERHGFSD